MNALRAFESAARLESMSGAADELHVTQSAVSKQIKTLEDWLGEPLFERLHREIKLTAKGRRYFETITALLSQLDEVTRALAKPQERVTVRFVGYQSFNMRWLIPRLASFYAEYPHVQVEISAENGPVDLRRGQVDCAIRTGAHDDWPGFQATPVAPIVFRPVSRPLRTGDPALDNIADLRRHVLIVSRTRADVWRKWLQAAGLTQLEPAGWVVFDHGSYCYQAALEGVGVALAETILVEEDIRSGRLFYPFLLDYRDALSYYFLHPSGAKPGVREFGDWLVRQATAAHGPA